MKERTGVGRIVAVTPNPAIDRTLTLSERLTPAQLHRVRGVREAAGGKGMNLARAVRALGGAVVVATVVAGRNGQKFRDLVEREGLENVLEESAGETRACTIVLDGGPHPTELNEAGPAFDPDAWRRLVARLPAGRVVVSGSLPPGLEPEAFRRLLSDLPGPVAVDTGGLALVVALGVGVALVAPNERELAEAARELCMPSVSDPVATARALRDRFGSAVLLTRGAAGAVLVEDEAWWAAAPEVTAGNPVGSGDCLLGAYVLARSAGEAAADALRLGVAAGAENARRGGGGTLDGDAVRALAGSVELRRLHI